MDTIAMAFLVFIFSFAIGIVVGVLSVRKTSGHGKYDLQILDDEEGLYQVSIQLDKDQDLTKRKRVILDKTQI